MRQFDPATQRIIARFQDVHDFQRFSTIAVFIVCLCTVSERIEGDKDRPGVRIIKSLDELDTSGLSTARGSNLCRKVNKPFPDMLTSHMEGH